MNDRKIPDSGCFDSAAVPMVGEPNGTGGQCSICSTIEVQCDSWNRTSTFWIAAGIVRHYDSRRGSSGWSNDCDRIVASTASDSRESDRSADPTITKNSECFGLPVAALGTHPSSPAPAGLEEPRRSHRSACQHWLWNPLRIWHWNDWPLADSARP